MTINDDDPLTNSLGGNFHNVLISQITIGERFRKDYGDIKALSLSIRNFGLLEPIILDRENNLLAGGRRLKAVTELGHLRIPTQYLDEISPIKAREIELEENLQRKNLDWPEQIALISEIDKLKKVVYADQVRYNVNEDGPVPVTPRATIGWTQKDTAQFIGLSESQLSRKLALADALEVMPSLAEEDSESQAIKRIDRRIEELEREIEFRRNKATRQLDSSNRALLGDCTSLLKDIEDKTIDLIIIDPPYGVLEPGGIGRYESGVHFNDDPLVAMSTLRQAAGELKRIAKDDAHIYVFFGIKMFVETKTIFTDLGFDVDPIPLVWVKTTGSVVDWDYRFSNFYEPILFITNRTRRLASGKHSNVLMFSSVPVGERSNIAEKPIDLLKHLIELSSHEGDVVLDCFAGSGSTGLAAKSTNRRFILIEKDEQQWKEINNRLNALDSSTSPVPIRPLTDEELS